MFQRRSRIVPTFFTVFVGVISGVLANRVDALFFSSNPQPRALFLANLIPWGIAGFLMLCIFGVLSLRWFDMRMWEKLLTFNEGLMRLPPNLIGKDDFDERLHKLVDTLLRYTMKKFPPGIRRGILLIPDSSRNNSYLIISNSVGIQEDYEQLDEFYVGTDKNMLKKRGIAGKAFQEKEPFLVHIRLTTENKWRADDDDFLPISYTENEDSDAPPFQSLICMPILDGSIEKKAPKQSLGVVCFDSQIMHMFDSYESKKRLELLAKHLCFALRTYNALKTSKASSTKDSDP